MGVTTMTTQKNQNYTLNCMSVIIILHQESILI